MLHRQYGQQVNTKAEQRLASKPGLCAVRGLVRKGFAVQAPALSLRLATQLCVRIRACATKRAGWAAIIGGNNRYGWIAMGGNHSSGAPAVQE